MNIQANAWSNFSFFFSRGRVMFCEIYAQLKASKILAGAVQNPDKCPGRGAERCGKKISVPLLILILLAKQIALESNVIYICNFGGK